jgi:transcriptional regulator with XRE-family HTH domain
MATRYNNLNVPKDLGARIHAARKRRHLTLKTLELKLRISHTQISRIERGQFVLMSRNVRKICRFLKISTNPSPIRNEDLEVRLAHFAKQSPQWRRVIAALVEAIEHAETHDEIAG